MQPLAAKDADLAMSSTELGQTASAVNKKRTTVIGRLSLAELEDRILAIRRMAERRHVTQAEWKTVDRMRKRANALRKEQAS